MRKELPCTRGTIEELWEENVILHSEELGDILLHMEDAVVVEAATGFPAQLTDGEEALVWLGEAMTLSYPPQTTPLLTAVDLTGEVPQFHEIAAVAGDRLVTTCGETLTVTAETRLVPYRTRQIVRPEDLVPGVRLLVWEQDGRMMAFFPEA